MPAGTAMPGPVLVMGAGAVGCWLGGRLAAAGAEVLFVGRPRVLDALREAGLTLSALDGSRLSLPPDRLRLAGTVPEGAAPALVLLAVKSGATADAAAELGARLPAGTPVVSMQNGLSNAAVAAAAAPSLTVLPGMVPYNVAELRPGHFHRGTEGRLAAQDHAALRPWRAAFEAAGLPLDLHADLRAVQWGKLMLNLNNAVNALSGLPLRAQLLDRDLRCCTAALIDEALAVAQALGIEPAQMAALPPRGIARVMRLPTPLFRLLAARMLRIDDQARSSMADDLALGRPTEVDSLNGEVVRLARSIGREAPRNARAVELVQAWPAAPTPWPGRRLREALQA